MIERHLAESCVIGSILIDARCLKQVSVELTVDDIELEINKVIYRAIQSLDRLKQPIDPVTVLNEANKQGNRVSREYILQLMDMTATAANISAYVELTRDNSLRRQVREIADNLGAQMQQPDILPADMIAKAGMRLRDIDTKATTKKLITTQDAIEEFFQYRLDFDSGAVRPFVSTGFPNLDAQLGGGFLRSGFYVLAARPGMGKTAMGINISDNIPTPGLFISLEMPVAQITARRLARECGIPYNRLLMGQLSEEEYELKAKAETKLYEQSQCSFNSSSHCTVEEISSLAMAVDGLSYIMVDYIGIISPSKGMTSSRTEYMTEISRELKSLALQYNVPVICLAQLNRETMKRSNPRPQLSDLRDTGAIEQDADGVIMLHRPDYYDESSTIDKSKERVILDVDVVKHRHGPTGMCSMTYLMPTNHIRQAQRISTPVAQQFSEEGRRVKQKLRQFKQLPMTEAVPF